MRLPSGSGLQQPGGGVFHSAGVKLLCCVVIIAGLAYGCSNGKHEVSRYDVVHPQIEVAMSAFDQERLTDAEADFRRILARYPDYPAAQSGLGRCLEGEYRYDEALAVFKQDLSEHSKDGWTACENAVLHENVGRALIETGHVQEGKAEVKIAASPRRREARSAST